MDINARPIIAYIGGVLVSNKKSGSVYDYSQSKYIHVNGDISSKKVNVYDYNRRCYVSGNRSSSEFSLYDYGNRNYITLKVNGSNFEGFCYKTSKHQNITVHQLVVIQ